MEKGLCETDRDARAKAISLWYCLAVDLITDIMSKTPLQLRVDS
jgi:hypothetical protein